MSKTILYAKNTYELLKILSNNPGTKVVGGCTLVENLPQKFISTRGIKELSQITRHERYIDVGSGATLSEILNVGQSHLPQILYEALIAVANPQIRNIATIGGNICEEGRQMTLFAPLMALDAKLEFKSQQETKTESIRNFKGIPPNFILSNVRIPIENSELCVFRKIGRERLVNKDSASFAFLADTEKNSLLKIHLAFAGPFAFFSKDFENQMIGQRLPLSQKDINEIQNLVAKEFQKCATDKMISEVMKQQFLNLTRYSFEQLT